MISAVPSLKVCFGPLGDMSEGFAWIHMIRKIRVSPAQRPTKRSRDQAIHGAYMALNSSNGCPQARHQHTDLHAVVPNSLRTSVSRESQ